MSDARPGSVDKVELLRRRYEDGEELFQDGDATNEDVRVPPEMRFSITNTKGVRDAGKLVKRARHGATDYSLLRLKKRRHGKQHYAARKKTG